MNTPRPLGFWHYPYDGQQELPYPGALVCPGWLPPDEITKLIAYLKTGATYETWRGLSHCRFQCGVDDREMGCRDFTDGLWIWPEGLYHYIETHDIRLPEEFIASCRMNNWSIPANAVAKVELSHELDYSSWIRRAKSIQGSAEPDGAANAAPPHR
jgi:hypothetical protein